VSVIRFRSGAYVGNYTNFFFFFFFDDVLRLNNKYLYFRSNAGHPFAAGLTLAKLAAVTVDENGKETFVTGGALDRVQKASGTCSADDL